MNDERIFLGLGSNLGDRAVYLESARAALKDTAGISFIAASSIYETAPVGVVDQPAFLNQVIEVRSGLSPAELLEKALEIEKSLGRERRERWGPRTIDIDMLCYGERVIRTDLLTLPHPEAHRRRFVLVPWAEIAPEFVLASLQKNIADLLAAYEDFSVVQRVNVVNGKTVSLAI